MSDRPLIAVDCDGVLYCWDRTARYMLRERYRRTGRTPPTALKEPANHWHMIQHEVSPRDWDWLWDEGVEQGLFRHGDIMSGAIFGLQELHNLGDLMIVTSRPEQGVYDTMSWLVHHLRQTVPLVGVHILSHGQPKSSVENPEPDLLIDDGGHNLEDWLDNTDSSFILFDQPWNTRAGRQHGESPRWQRAYGWKGVVDQSETLLTKRREWTGRNREIV